MGWKDSAARMMFFDLKSYDENYLEEKDENYFGVS